MQVHAVDPLVQRIIADRQPPVAGQTPAPDWRETREREVEAEPGLSVPVLDRLVRELVWEARNEERVRAKRAEAAARDAGFDAGFARGVEVAVEHVRAQVAPGFAGRAAWIEATVTELSELLGGVKAGPGLPAGTLSGIRWATSGLEVNAKCLAEDLRRALLGEDGMTADEPADLPF